MELVMLGSFILLILDDFADLLVLASTAGIGTEILVWVICHTLVSVLVEAAATQKMHGGELQGTVAASAFVISDLISLAEFLQLVSSLNALLSVIFNGLTVFLHSFLLGYKYFQEIIPDNTECRIWAG